MSEEKRQGFVSKYRIDIIVIASLLLLSLAVLLLVNLTRKEGAYAEIIIDGETVGKYPLAIDGVYELNGGTNTLTVKDGKAYMSYSSCPDHICENTGSVTYVGQTIVCLPNEVTVRIVGKSGDSVDFVS